ncbi:unnamed protein product [Linum tenue]|uniref:Coenzyme Q-binding protein COQ10 START domain-containing protein n=1 Tax=Linum tenue TaxID=586396 RepID=A0AAV0J225_9ROSI|nr:unnamed protein product [Linum tenue]
MATGRMMIDFPITSSLSSTSSTCCCSQSPSFNFLEKTAFPLNSTTRCSSSSNAAVCFSSRSAKKWNSNSGGDVDCDGGVVVKNENDEDQPQQQRRREKVGGGGGEARRRQRRVICEVEVVSWRERRIRAQILVNSDIQSIWIALTDYERLADYIPNLLSSGRIPCPHPGRIWLEQRGLQRALYWHIEARVVLDLQEFPISADKHELHFSMVDGDFKKFEGKWSLNCGTRPGTTVLAYEVSVIPRFNFPAIFLERIIRSDLPVNLQALACRAENQVMAMGNHKTKTDELSRSTSGARDIEETYNSTNSSPVPASAGDISCNWGIFGKACSLEKRCLVDEVHLRRFDGLLENGGVHRGVIASITVKSPLREVWNVLTAYESLPEIVPNLAISKILSRENNKVRILQEGCKGLLYMVLHARVVLDLCELHEREISFVQVDGDFDSFHGKWVLEQLGSHHTLLKYVVESKMHKDTFLSEAIMEEVIYEDLPSNLCAIRDYVEKMQAANSLEPDDLIKHSEHEPSSSNHTPVEEQQVSDSGNAVSSRQRPRVPGLQRDIEILKSELLKFVSEHGQEGFMPMRKQLRLHGRVDIEKAITRMGGFRRIASLMNLSLAYKHRKPKGYWDSLENLQEEIKRFQRSWGMDPSFMPSRTSFERAGRYDIARALEKWGGLHEVSRLLALKVRHPTRQLNLVREKKFDQWPLSSAEVEDKISSTKADVSQNTQKWLTKLKDLDIDWGA